MPAVQPIIQWEKWIADTGTSDHSSSYKEGCLKLKVYKSVTVTIGKSGEAVLIEHVMDHLAQYIMNM